MQDLYGPVDRRQDTEDVRELDGRSDDAAGTTGKVPGVQDFHSALSQKLKPLHSRGDGPKGASAWGMSSEGLAMSEPFSAGADALSDALSLESLWSMRSARVAVTATATRRTRVCRMPSRRAAN